jgi:hypothetical protein
MPYTRGYAGARKSIWYEVHPTPSPDGKGIEKLVHRASTGFDCCRFTLDDRALPHQSSHGAVVGDLGHVFAVYSSFWTCTERHLPDCGGPGSVAGLGASALRPHPLCRDRRYRWLAVTAVHHAPHCQNPHLGIDPGSATAWLVDGILGSTVGSAFARRRVCISKTKWETARLTEDDRISKPLPSRHAIIHLRLHCFRGIPSVNLAMISSTGESNLLTSAP